MNCWVCEGHGNLIDQEHNSQKFGKNIKTSEEGKATIRAGKNLLVCHYCNGRGFIEVAE
jgi:RecJ-like exonuclease